MNSKLKISLKFSDTTIIIPTLNEGKNIGTLLDLIQTKYQGIRVIVADDGSKDNTQLIINSYSKRNKRITLIDRSAEKTKGLTASVIDAVKRTSTKYLIVIDGDLQHPPEKIGEIRDKLSFSKIVGCERKKVLVNWPAHRKLISTVATYLARARLGIKINDPLSGFFGAETDLFKQVLKRHEKDFEKEGYKVFFELLKYRPKDSSPDYVQYEFGLRKGGESKIKAKHILLFLKSVFK